MKSPISLISCLFVTLTCIIGKLPAQSKLAITDSSRLTGISLGPGVWLDTRSLFTGLAKATLEMEFGAGTVKEMEVLHWSNPSGKKFYSERWIDTLKDKLFSHGWRIDPSKRDPSFFLLTRSENAAVVAMYQSPGKKQADLYFGTLIRTDTNKIMNLTEPVPGPLPSQPASTAAANAGPGVGLTGTWGNLSISKLNFYDDATGYMIGSGLSTGSGYQFHEDGTFVRSFLATSSRPDYKIFIYLTGSFSVSGNELNLFPKDLHYRKWESDQLVTDEHSKPAAEYYFWEIRTNPDIRKNCLYLKKKGETKETEFCGN